MSDESEVENNKDSDKSPEQVENDQANNAVINLAINMKTFILTG